MSLANKTNLQVTLLRAEMHKCIDRRASLRPTGYLAIVTMVPADRSPSSPRSGSAFAFETLRNLTDPLESVLPSLAGALLDLLRDLAYRLMREPEPRAVAFRRQPVLHVVDGRVRHELRK
jgi:hypothetical protein